MNPTNTHTPPESARLTKREWRRGAVVRKDAGIKTEKDFDGKTSATPQLGNTPPLGRSD